MADVVESSSEHREEPTELETRVLAEKAMGLSDLEVAAKLMLSEWTVRSIVRKHGRESSTTFRLRQGLEIGNGAQARGLPRGP